MDDDRFASLLEETLRTGAVPAAASAEERAELEAASSRVLAVRAGRGPAGAEARAAMPTARARFERFVAAERAAMPGASAAGAAQKRRRGLFGGGLTSRWSFASVAAGMVLVALVALFAGQFTGNGDVAVAQVLTPGGYVQLEGVVEEVSSSGDEGTVVISSALGDVSLALGANASIVDAAGNVDARQLRAGDSVVVSGVVSERAAGARPHVVAHTLAVGAGDGVRARLAAIQELKKLQPGMRGRVITFVLGADGTGRALIETANGRRHLVLVEPGSAERLLRLASALGARVEVRPAAGGAAAGLFSLELLAGQGGEPGDGGTAAPSASAVARPDGGGAGARPVHIDGVIASRTGLVLQVATRRGPVAVRVAAHTRVLVGESGFRLADFVGGQPAIGHVVSVTGGLDRATGEVIADVVVIGPKAPARPTAAP